MNDQHEGGRALRLERGQLEAILDAIPHGVYIVSRDCDIEYINPVIEREFGAIGGRKCYEYFHDLNQVCTWCKNDEVFAGRSVRWEWYSSKNDRHYDLFDLPIENPDGTISKFEIFSDITKLKRAEKELNAEKELLAVTLDSIADAVIVIDDRSAVASLNRMAERMTGWSEEEARGRPFGEVIRVEARDTGRPVAYSLTEALDRDRALGQPDGVVLVAGDGKRRSIADRGAPILDRSGHRRGVVLVLRDVTDQLRLQEELQKVQRLESIGVLAGGIAHDFNNILTAILGNIDLVMQNDQPRGESAQLLESARRASLRARDLTHQLLTFSRGGTPAKMPLSIEGLVRDAATLALGGSSCDCEIDAPEGLWTTEVDRGQISQVISNLMINACHAMPEGGTIGLALENLRAGPADRPLPPGRPFVRVSVRDRGVGIAPQHLAKVFDPYFTTKQRGSGLGLAVSHSIVRAHGGLIRAESELGTGTTMMVYLAADPEIETAPVDAEPALVGGSGRVLVMDDEEAIGKLVGAMLTRLGYDSSLARAGEEAVDLFRAAHDAGAGFDAVVLDLTVPGGMGGREALREMRKIDPGVKAIVASGYSNDATLADFERYGFRASIAKPFGVGELNRVLAAMLEERPERP